MPVESPLCSAGRSSLATCLGVASGHGRVRVGEERLVVGVAHEAILRYAQVSNNVLADVVR